VAFPEDVLTENEHVVLHLHPHWKALVRPVLVLALGVAALVVGWTLLPGGVVPMYILAGIVLVALLWLALWPFLTWRTTHYVFTNERVLLQQGVLARDRRDIPLSRVNDHAMTQRFSERLLGCGTLTIESAGERGQSVLAGIPRVERVQTTLYELVEADRDAHTVGDREMRDMLEAVREDRPRRRWRDG
jgi:uncharacterized membrane protein YdbT with pleckstrin-like domain